MSKPLADLFLERTVFDEQAAHEKAISIGYDSNFPVQHKVHESGAKAENARTQKAREAVAAVVAAAEGFESCAQYREDEYISKLFLALKNLRDVLEGEK